MAHTQVHTRTHTHTHTALTMHPRASVAQVWARNSSPAVLREKWTDWVREGRTWGPSHPPQPPPDSENWGNGKVWPQGLAASPNPWGFSQLQNIYFRAWRSLSTRAALGDPQRGQGKPQGLKGVELEMGHGTSPWKRDREMSWSLRAGRRQVSTAPPSQGLKDWLGGEHFLKGHGGGDTQPHQAPGSSPAASPSGSQSGPGDPSKEDGLVPHSTWPGRTHLPPRKQPPPETQRKRLTVPGLAFRAALSPRLRSIMAGL